MATLKLDDDRLLTVKEVGEYLRLHPKTVRGLIDDGVLAAHKIGRQWRVSGRDLRTYLREVWRG